MRVWAFAHITLTPCCLCVFVDYVHSTCRGAYQDFNGECPLAFPFNFVEGI